MRRHALAAALATAVVAFGAAQLDRAGSSTGEAATASCKGRAVTVEVPRSRYPRIVAHIEDSWDRGYPRVLRVNRRGADERRERLLGWYEARHPQPKGDGLDLDEQPPAMLRSSWRADVRAVPQGENRSQGASMGGQLRGVRNGTCVRWRFTR